MASTKLIFNTDEVQRLRTKIGQVSQDTNRLYLQLKGQASGWGGIPMGGHFQDQEAGDQIVFRQINIQYR
ncbi:hypothetical protein QW71_26395 [Paenibacillus sp. IHB B 3415]|uniref:hypothetical protein n=1 Tax=Paenibacillus sp. IHB B 3415 TaxID=867080 RepID=UPI0005753FDD|nr:hypothetical protein [Paenibacillus sp. IHB B 3415]KHL92922.1 hypothetical protein QW71_26395 [Paenibacillus sp. IHB B 3415]